jgi:hypothetical protein
MTDRHLLCELMRATIAIERLYWKREDIETDKISQRISEK